MGLSGSNAVAVLNSALRSSQSRYGVDEADCWERTLSRLGSTGGQRHVALKETKAARQREQVFSDRSERWYMFVVQRSEDLR